MPVLRNEKLILALNVEAGAREAALVPLLDCLRDPSAKTRLLTTLKEETTLSDTLLLYARSKYFRHEKAPETLEQAEAAIGTSMLAKLALFSIAADAITQPFDAYALPPAAMIDLSLLNATMMEHTATLTGSPPLLGYALGLFHGFGRCILNAYLREIDPEQKHCAPEQEYFNLSRWERTNIGMSHANAASVLLVKWGLPEAFYRPIQFQNRPEDAGKIHRKLASQLNICLHVAAHSCMPEQNPPPVRSISTHYYEMSGIPWQSIPHFDGPARMHLMRMHHILTGVESGCA